MHDFPADKEARKSDSLYAKTHSISLYGNVTILSGENAEEMRLKHLERHGDEYAQFIVGKDIAVLSVDVESATLCNIKDQVTRWDSRYIEKPE